MELHIPHVSVDTILGDEKIVRSFLCNLPILENDDIVGIPYCPKTMSNHQNGAFSAKAVKGFLNAVFRQRVERRSSFIEQHEWRVLL